MVVSGRCRGFPAAGSGLTGPRPCITLDYCLCIEFTIVPLNGARQYGQSLMFASLLEKLKPESLATGKRPTVLIIDDDEVLVDVLSRRLQQQGFETISATSGESGLAKVRSDRPVLIVLDLLLPDMDGLEICEKLADSSETCDVPVIILSGLGEPDILRRCRAAGGRYFVRKPYDPNALLVLIRQAVREADGWDDSDA